MKIKQLAVLIISGLLSLSAIAATNPSTNSGNNQSVAAGQHASHHSTRDKPASTQVVNINKADENTLSTLKGIGKKRAAAIVAYRNANGAFKSVGELTKVKGISQKIIDKNKGRLTV